MGVGYYVIFDPLRQVMSDDLRALAALDRDRVDDT